MKFLLWYILLGCVLGLLCEFGSKEVKDEKGDLIVLNNAERLCIILFWPFVLIYGIVATIINSDDDNSITPSNT